MARFKFFNFVKPYQFEYRPRYWDPDREDLEKRLRAAEKRREAVANAKDPEAMKARISQGFRRQSYYEETRQLRRRHARRSSVRLLVILIFLIIGAFVILNLYLPALEQFVEGN